MVHTFSRLDVLCKNISRFIERKFSDGLYLSNFFCVLRKNNSIKSTQTIFLLCNNKLLNMSSTIEDIYKLEKEKDNFLYFILTIENTFGF